MNQTFRKTDYSKLFFIRTRLIFPMCLIYTPVTETLLKEILMKKEEEFLQIVSQSIYVQGLSREWSGFAQRWWKSSCPESLSQGFVTLSDLYRALQRKFVICLFPPPDSVLSFLSDPLLEKPGQLLPSWELPWLGGSPHASSLKHCACRQFLSAVNAAGLWLGWSSQSASATALWSIQKSCQYMMFLWSI